MRPLKTHRAGKEMRRRNLARSALSAANAVYRGLMVFAATGTVIVVIQARPAADPAAGITAALVLFWTMLIFGEAAKIRGIGLVRKPPARLSRLDGFLSGWGHIIAVHPALYRYLLEPVVIFLFAFFALAAAEILLALF
jgi:hypothetical protein